MAQEQQPKKERRGCFLGAMFGGLASLIALVAGVVEIIDFVRPDPTTPRERNQIGESMANVLGGEGLPAPTPTEDLLAIHEPRLLNAIDLAAYAEIEAFRELSDEPLYTIYKGEALKTALASVELLRDSALYALSQRNSITIDWVEVTPDGRHGRVRAIPVYEVWFYSIATNECVGYWPPYEVPQVVSLEQTEDGWMITAIVFEDDSQRPIQPCP